MVQRRVLAERVDQKTYQRRGEEAHVRIARSAPERVEHQDEASDPEVERVPLGRRDEFGTEEGGELAGIERMLDRRRVRHLDETRHRPVQPDPAIGEAGVLGAQQELRRGQQDTAAEGHGPLQQGHQRPAGGPGRAPCGQRADADVSTKDDGGVERRLDVTTQEHEGEGIAPSTGQRNRPSRRPATSAASTHGNQTELKKLLACAARSAMKPPSAKATPDAAAAHRPVSCRIRRYIP